MADQKKKPILSRKTKRIVLFFGLLIAFPAVIAGALTPQNLHQEASTGDEKPNIILIQVDNQRADTVSAMKMLRSSLQQNGMTFTNAYAADAWDENTLRTGLAGIGYTTPEVQDPAQAAVVVKSAKQPFFLNVHASTITGATSDQSCTETVSVSNPAVNEADVSDKPRAIRTIPLLSTAQLTDIEATKRSQLCRLQTIDREVGEILSSLGEKQQHTIVVYTAANGYAWGEHRLTGNACLYEACRQVPLVISYPGLFKTALTSRALVQTADIPATLLQLAGGDISQAMTSLVPLFTRPDVPIHHYLHFTSRSGDSVGVRSEEFLYLKHQNGEREFYDMVADPLELSNQINASVYRADIDRLSHEVNTAK